MNANQISRDVLQLAGAAQEFLLVGDADGKFWAFPRIHMVSAKIPAAGIAVFDFGTHRVTIFSNDARGDLTDWLAGKCELLAVPDYRPAMTSARRISKVDIEVKT